MIASYATTPAETDLEKYQLPDSILEQYKLEVSGTNIVLRAKTTAYVDGVSGNDSNDGNSPTTAFKTLNKAYTTLGGGGGTIFIVNTVSITGTTQLTGTMYLDSSGKEALDSGKVTISRYAQPSAYNANTVDETGLTGFSTESFTGELFNVQSGGTLKVSDLVIDGHGTGVDVGVAATTSDGVEATAAMIRVSKDGELDLSDGAVLKNNNNTSNNGGAVRIYSGGTVSMDGGEIRDNISATGAGISALRNGADSDTVAELLGACSSRQIIRRYLPKQRMDGRTIVEEMYARVNS